MVMPTKRQRLRIAHNWRRKNMVQELGYYREIRKLFLTWYLNSILKPLAKNTGLRFDADEEFLTAAEYAAAGTLFENAAEEWPEMVQTFTIRMMKRANNIANIAKIEWSKAMGVDMSVNPFASEPWLNPPLRAFQDENVALIKNIGDEAFQKIGTIVENGYKQGISTKKIAEQIANVGDVYAGYRSKLIARDQLGKLSGNLTQIRAEISGVDEYEWSSSNDERVRPEHEIWDGDIRSYSKDSPHPGEPIQCRCVALPII